MHMTHLANLPKVKSHGHFIKEQAKELIVLAQKSVGANPNKLLAFTSPDSSVHQSENFQAERTRMSKRDSLVLRYALVNAAWNVVVNNSTFKAYYDTKRVEGRTHYNALGTVPGNSSELSGRCSLTM